MIVALVSRSNKRKIEFKYFVLLSGMKINKNDWTYYQVGQDEYSYSWEMPGIQMTFNESIPFQKAKKIADEIVEKIRATGQDAELMTLDKTKVYRLD